MKIRRVGAQLFHADGQTDRYDEANSHFSQFRVAPKGIYIYVQVFTEVRIEWNQFKKKSSDPLEEIP